LRILSRAEKMLAVNMPLRLAGRVPSVYTRSHTLPRSVTQLRALALSPKTSFSVKRNYATPGRPKGAVGEPTRTVKRAVKRGAATDKATDASPKRATKPASSSSKSSAKKPAKSAAKKTKKTTTKKPRKTVKKAAKVLSDEEQELATRKAAAKTQRTAAKRQEVEIKNLKALALDLPDNLRHKRPIGAWVCFMAERSRGASKPKDNDIGHFARDASEAFSALSPAEIEVRLVPFFSFALTTFRDMP